MKRNWLSCLMGVAGRGCCRPVDIARLIQNSRFKSPDGRFKIPDLNVRIQDSRFSIRDLNVRTHDSGLRMTHFRFKTPDSGTPMGGKTYQTVRSSVNSRVSHPSWGRIWRGSPFIQMETCKLIRSCGATPRMLKARRTSKILENATFTWSPV